MPNNKNTNYQTDTKNIFSKMFINEQSVCVVGQ